LTQILTDCIYLSASLKYPILLRYYLVRNAPGLNERAYQALVHVLPPSVIVQQDGERVVVNGVRLRLSWIGEGWLADARRMLGREVEEAQVAVARRMSPGAREALRAASVGWVDETGAVEITTDGIVVSKSGRPQDRTQRIRDWTPSVLAVAEALLCGTNATVASTSEVTGLSSGSCTNALRFLEERGLLASDASRGRYSARRIADGDRFLESYAAAATEVETPPEVRVGLVWREPRSAVAKIGRKWDSMDVSWACTGAIATSVLAPHLTTFGSADVYVDVDTVAGLESTAVRIGLEPTEGGRLKLRPFPTVTARRLATEEQGLRLAPWPRVYSDVRLVGVRGEEAAEHLRAVVHARS
jgi:hypothetical protein